MNSKTHLRDYFPNYLSSDSLFTKMSQLGAPWSQEVGQDMDDAYFTMYSGIKNPSEFVLLHLNPDSDIANSLTLARILYGIYGENWKKLWEAFKTKYIPIDNYNVQEAVKTTHKSDRSINRTNDLTSAVGGTDKQTSSQNTTQNVNGSTGSNSTSDSNGTNALEHGEQIQSDGQTDSYVHAFNSAEKVPTDVQIVSSTDVHSGTDTTTTTEHSTSEATGTNEVATTEVSTGEVDNVTNSYRADKNVEDTIDNTEGTENIQRTRQGNVGQISYQELLHQEFELWRWNFYMQVFEDVDKFLVLSVYSSCTNH